MGTSLAGNWWIPIVYTFGWVLNISSEELWFRGWVLPKMEPRLGGWAWVVNGFLFCLWHWFWSFNLVVILPSALIFAYVAWRTRSTWSSMIVHGVMNGLVLISLFMGVLNG